MKNLIIALICAIVFVGVYMWTPTPTTTTPTTPTTPTTTTPTTPTTPTTTTPTTPTTTFQNIKEGDTVFGPTFTVETSKESTITILANGKKIEKTKKNTTTIPLNGLKSGSYTAIAVNKNDTINFFINNDPEINISASQKEKNNVLTFSFSSKLEENGRFYLEISGKPYKNGTIPFEKELKVKMKIEGKIKVFVMQETAPGEYFEADIELGLYHSFFLFLKKTPIWGYTVFKIYYPYTI